MARTGIRNWQDNWKGSDKQSVVKIPAPYYIKSQFGTYQTAGNLVKDTQITYLDNLTENHTKAAFKFNNSDEVFYANIDKFVKPGQIGGIDLTLQGFGLDNKTYINSFNYASKVIDAIGDRWETNQYSGELYDYLFQIVEYAKTGNPAVFIPA